MGSVSCENARACFCKGKRYTCPGCKRFVPWCYGASDEHFRLCDDCAVVLFERQERDLPTNGDEAR